MLRSDQIFFSDYALSQTVPQLKAGVIHGGSRPAEGRCQSDNFRTIQSHVALCSFEDAFQPQPAPTLHALLDHGWTG